MKPVSRRTACLKLCALTVPSILGAAQPSTSINTTGIRLLELPGTDGHLPGMHRLQIVNASGESLGNVYMVTAGGKFRFMCRDTHPGIFSKGPSDLVKMRVPASTPSSGQVGESVVLAVAANYFGLRADGREAPEALTVVPHEAGRGSIIGLGINDYETGVFIDSSGRIRIQKIAKDKQGDVAEAVSRKPYAGLFFTKALILNEQGTGLERGAREERFKWNILAQIRDRAGAITSAIVHLTEPASLLEAKLILDGLNAPPGRVITDAVLLDVGVVGFLSFTDGTQAFVDRESGFVPTKLQTLLVITVP